MASAVLVKVMSSIFSVVNARLGSIEVGIDGTVGAGNLVGTLLRSLMGWLAVASRVVT